MAGSVDSGSLYGISDEYIDPWCDPCANDDKYARVVSYCPVCVEFFCKQCNRSHSNFEITKSHLVKRGSDMPSCQAEKPPKYEECRIHARELKEYFCTVHSKMICQKCQKDHKSCSVTHATVISKTLKKVDINNLENDVTDAQKEASNAKNALEFNIKNIEEKRKDMLRTANKEYNEMKTNIKASFKRMTKEINNKCDEEVSSLTAFIKDCSDGIAQYDLALTTIQKEARSKLDTKLFVKLQSLVDKTRLNNTSLHETTVAVKASDIQFDVDSRWTSLLSSCPEIGTVRKIISPFSPAVPLRKIDFPPEKAELFRDVTFAADSSLQNKPPVIAAVSLGTKCSTYCFGLLYELKQNPLNQRFRHWKTIYGAATAIQTPMTILLAPDKQNLLAFGYEAEIMYQDLYLSDEHVDYYYFPDFGMNLREVFKKTDLRGDNTTKDATGKVLWTKSVLGLAMKFIYDDFLGLLSKVNREIRPPDVLWTITAPCSWTEAPKQFIKEATKEVGMPAENICIVTEPEAAASFCRSILADEGEDLRHARVKTGQKYLILNVGDRETEIIVDSHTPFVVPQQVRIASSESVSEGLMDDVLNTLFAEILGVDVFQTFVETKPDQWLDMKTSLIPKLNLKDRQRNSVTLLLSIEMLMFYETMKGKTLKEAIAANSALATNVSIIGNKMRIGDHFFRKFYEMPAKKVILLITTALRSLQEERIDTIFIIGKLTKGSYLQNIIRSSFADITFVFPTEPETAVVRGAVIHSFCQQEKWRPESE